MIQLRIASLHDKHTEAADKSIIMSTAAHLTSRNTLTFPSNATEGLCYASMSGYLSVKCFYLTVEMTEIKAQSAAYPASSVLLPNGTHTEYTLNTYTLCALSRG